MPAKTTRRETPALVAFLKQFKQGNTLLLTLGNLRSLPELYNQETMPDPLCTVKFFGASRTWYAVEARIVCDCGENGETPTDEIVDVLFFGKTIVHGESELGYFSLKEIANARQRGRIVGYGSYTFKNERDQYWTPTRLSECN